MNYKFLAHTADVKFKAYGKSLNEVFDNCALAFKETIAGEQDIKNNKSKMFEIKGKDNEDLLCRFLDELLYLLDAEEFIVCKTKVEIKDGNLNAKVYGDSTSNYHDLEHVKAATYSEMYVKKIKGNWEAQVVLDV